MKFFRFLAPLLLVATAGAAGSIDVFHRQWTVPEPSDWNISGDGDAQVLTLQHARNPLPGPRRPIQFALTPIEPYRTLTLEADVQPWQLSLIIVFAYQDEAHFNYAHLSVDTGVKQPVHNGIFHVYGGERVRISSTRGPSAFPVTKKWYHVTLTHDAVAGTVDVSVNGEPIPALHAVDVSLGAGRLGLGSFDETGEFRNVKIVEHR